MVHATETVMETGLAPISGFTCESAQYQIGTSTLAQSPKLRGNPYMSLLEDLLVNWLLTVHSLPPDEPITMCAEYLT